MRALHWKRERGGRLITIHYTGIDVGYTFSLQNQRRWGGGRVSRRRRKNQTETVGEGVDGKGAWSAPTDQSEEPTGRNDVIGSSSSSSSSRPKSKYTSSEYNGQEMIESTFFFLRLPSFFFCVCSFARKRSLLFKFFWFFLFVCSFFCSTTRESALVFLILQKSPTRPAPSPAPHTHPFLFVFFREKKRFSIRAIRIDGSDNEIEKWLTVLPSNRRTKIKTKTYPVSR